MKSELTCIVCPLGCQLTVEQNEQAVVVTGNRCPKGNVYAVEELTNPMRTITTTVYIEGARYPRLPVMSNGRVPKVKIFDIMEEINAVRVQAPVTYGQVIVENVLGLGVDIVATREMEYLSCNTNNQSSQQ
ncbi:MAG: DUF1667 domain-containing protein [Erysipelotrichaceae bacterium]